MSHACVSLVCSLPGAQKDLSDYLKKNVIEASCAWDVYKPMDVHNATLVHLVSARLEVSESEANAKLMGRIKVPKRKANGRSDSLFGGRRRHGGGCVL